MESSGAVDSPPVMLFGAAFLKCFIALLAIVDPPGNVGIVLGITEADEPHHRRRQILRGHIWALALLVVFLFAGRAVLMWFGLTVDAVRVGGGLILLKIGFDLLTAEEKTKHSAEEDADSRTRKDVSFFPLAMPLIAGPGAITVVLSSAVEGSQQSTEYWLGALVAIFAVILISWLILNSATGVLRMLGKSGVAAITRIMGFLIICISVQMILVGAEQILKHGGASTAMAAAPAEQQAAPGSPQGEPAAPDASAPPRVLVFSKTAGFRHSSIPRGIEAVREICADDYAVDATEDAAQFTPDNLRQYTAIIFLSTTGDVLDPEQEKAFEGWLRAGGGYVGIHAAADTEYDCPFYQQAVGAAFKSHPRIQPATVKVENREHPSTKMLPEAWPRTDEWYSYRANPRATTGMLILAALDESTSEGGGMGDHPIAWCHEIDKGRAWYTGGGHTDESFSEELFRAHLRGGLDWATRRAPQ